jgi:hypothetical protein
VATVEGSRGYDTNPFRSGGFRGGAPPCPFPHLESDSAPTRLGLARVSATAINSRDLRLPHPTTSRPRLRTESPAFVTNGDACAPLLPHVPKNSSSPASVPEPFGFLGLLLLLAPQAVAAFWNKREIAFPQPVVSFLPSLRCACCG